MKRRLPHLGCLAFLLVAAAVYYSEILGRLPFGIHDWAQSDRLSLAINFYDNGFNFFKPATHSQLSKGGIVGVEFPIQSYIAALLGCVFGRGAISSCFRVEGVLLALTGLYFLFRTAYDRSRDFLLSMLPPLLLFCSPVFVFYSASCLPDPAAVSLSLIAFFYFLRYTDSNRLRPLMACAALITLAVLVKTTIVSYWLGIAAYALYRELRAQQRSPRRIMAVSGAFLLGGLVVLAQFWYIRYLNKTYGGFLFLSKPNPFADWKAFISYLENQFKDDMMPEYFLLVEYPIILLLMVMGLRGLLKAGTLRHYLRPLAVFVPGCLVLFWLFGAQFVEHDYYALAIFFPLIAYLLAVSVTGICRSFGGEHIRALRLGLGTAALLLFFMADHQNYQRFHQLRRYDIPYSYTTWVGAKATADSAGIPNNACLLVCGDGPPNLALVYLDHKGIVLPQESFNDDMRVAAQKLKERAWKYAVLKGEAYLRIRANDSAALSSFRTLAQGGKMAILELKDGSP